MLTIFFTKFHNTKTHKRCQQNDIRFDTRIQFVTVYRIFGHSLTLGVVTKETKNPHTSSRMDFTQTVECQRTVERRQQQPAP
mmetsp:Transcript_20520/g.25169  ORF Transcript_20520/g.25169 Transcript_20520/m.25169 type:complete len:82 (-) Transcript_20520:1465-1710(-)